jgi:hypothetical protein
MVAVLGFVFVVFLECFEWLCGCYCDWSRRARERAARPITWLREARGAKLGRAMVEDACDE